MSPQTPAVTKGPARMAIRGWRTLESDVGRHAMPPQAPAVTKGASADGQKKRRPSTQICGKMVGGENSKYFLCSENRFPENQPLFKK